MLPPQISRTIPNRRFFRPVHQQEGVASFDHLYKIHQLLCLDQNQHSKFPSHLCHIPEKGESMSHSLWALHTSSFRVSQCTEFVRTSFCLTQPHVSPMLQEAPSPMHLPAVVAALHRDGPSTLVHDRTHPSDWQSLAAWPSSLLSPGNTRTQCSNFRSWPGLSSQTTITQVLLPLHPNK